MIQAEGRPGHASDLTLWVGTYPAPGGISPGSGEGIWRVSLDLRTGALSNPRQLATTPAPSYLAWGARGLLYATNEDVEGSLSVWRPTADSLDLVGVTSTGGAHPCHVHVDQGASLALVANYTSGSLAVVELDADGMPLTGVPQQVFAFDGSGPVSGRQEASHAHYVLPDPMGGAILVADLGADVIRRFRFDEGRRLREDGAAVRLPAGAGPRHAVFSSDGSTLYVLGELDGRLHTVAWDVSTATGRVMASDPVDPGARDATNPAHIVLTGGRLDIGARGISRIVTHYLDHAGRPAYSGGLRLPGSWPRHHAVVDDWLVVAQQKEGGVVTLTRDGAVAGFAEIPSPACVLPSSTLPQGAG